MHQFQTLEQERIVNTLKELNRRLKFNKKTKLTASSLIRFLLFAFIERIKEDILKKDFILFPYNKE